MIAALMWLMVPTPAQPAPPEDAAWVLAYSGFVSRFCPGWNSGLAPLEHILPTPETWNTVWGEGGVLQQAYRRGGLTAEAEHRRDPEFCAHPISSQPKHAALLVKVLSTGPAT